MISINLAESEQNDEIGRFEFIEENPKDPEQKINDACICNKCKRYFCIGYDSVIMFCDNCIYESETAVMGSCSKKYATVYSSNPKPIIIIEICRACAAMRRKVIKISTAKQNRKHKKVVPMTAKERRIYLREQKRKKQIKQAKNNVVLFPDVRTQGRRVVCSSRRTKPKWVGKKGHYTRDVCFTHSLQPSQRGFA